MWIDIGKSAWFSALLMIATRSSHASAHPFRFSKHPHPAAKLACWLTLAAMAAIGHAGCSGGKDSGLEDDESPAGGDSNTGSGGNTGSTDTNGTAGSNTGGMSDGNTGGSDGSGANAGDGGVGNGGSGDGGTVPLDPVAEGDWDAAVEVPEALVGATFVEKHNSFKVLYPPVFADIYGVLEELDLLGGETTRVFGQLVRDTNGDLEVRYGAMDLTGGDGNWTGSFQDRFTENTFRIAPSVDDPLLYVSQPFDYFLSMRITLDLIILPAQTFNVNLYTLQAQWTARFDEAFQNIEEGTLTSLLLRDEAKAASIRGAELFCVDLCTVPTAADPQAEQARVRDVCALQNQPFPQSLADLLDCREHAVDSDADGDGVPESYQVRLRFEGERITLQQ